MTIQGSKENQQSDADFFAQHPQPTLQEARFWEQDARLNQICLEQEQYLGLTLDEALEANENDDDLATAHALALAGNNDNDDDNEGNHTCNDVCACIRYLKDPEDEDSALYERKCAIQLDHSLQNKRQKCFDEHEPIPMDISDDEDEDEEDEDPSDSEDDDEDPSESEDDGEDDDEDDDEESKFICRHGMNCKNRVCDDCVWYLEQEARHAHPRRKEVAEVDYHADMIMPTLDDVGTITDIPMEIDDEDEDDEDEDEDDEDDEQEPRAPIRYQRQTTSWVNEETGETVYNGSSDGSRTSEVVEEDYSDLPDLIDVTAEQVAEERYNFNMYELEVTYRNGKDVYNSRDAERVCQLRREIAEYEKTRR
jgi:hypothetical protein